MRTFIMCTALALTFTTAGTAEQDIQSANAMLPGCKSILETENQNAPDYLRRGLCYGTIEGLVYALTPSRRLGALFCANIPAGVTFEQGVRVVVRYIDARPQRMHESFKSLALEALFDAWPCRK